MNRRPGYDSLIYLVALIVVIAMVIAMFIFPAYFLLFVVLMLALVGGGQLYAYRKTMEKVRASGAELGRNVALQSVEMRNKQASEQDREDE